MRSNNQAAPEMGPKPQSTDIMSNLSKLLPTGTFLTFQTLVPLFSNNGVCGQPEKIMTGILIFFFTVLCFMFQFVDSVTTESGKVYYGIVTQHGLFNPHFRKSNIPGDLLRGDNYFTGGDDNNDYKVHVSDYCNGLLNVITFGTLSCLTPPVTTCYYPGVPNTVVKTAPILVAMIVGIVFAFGPFARHGVGFALTTSGFGFVPDGRNNEGKQSSPPKSTSTSGSPGNPVGKVELTRLIEERGGSSSKVNAASNV